MAAEYDLVLMLDPEAPADRRAEIAEEVRKMIEAKGSIKRSADWGMRRMAYEIDHRSEADYRFYQFEGGNELLEQLGHTLKISDGVLRFRTIRLDPGMPEPPDLSAPPPTRPPEPVAEPAAVPAAPVEAPSEAAVPEPPVETPSEAAVPAPPPPPEVAAEDAAGTESEATGEKPDPETPEADSPRGEAERAE